MVNWAETTASIAETGLVFVRGGASKLLLILHDELGYPGWRQWNKELTKERELILGCQHKKGGTQR